MYTIEINASRRRYSKVVFGMPVDDPLLTHGERFDALDETIVFVWRKIGCYLLCV